MPSANQELSPRRPGFLFRRNRPVRREAEAPPRDQARPALVGRTGPCPVEENRHTVAESDQREEMYDQPGQPRDEAVQAQPAYLSDRGRAAYRRHAAAVDIVERHARRAVKRPENVARGVAAHLDRDWGDAGQRLAALMEEHGHVADRIRLRASRQ